MPNQLTDRQTLAAIALTLVVVIGLVVLTVKPEQEREPGLLFNAAVSGVAASSVSQRNVTGSTGGLQAAAARHNQLPTKVQVLPLLGGHLMGAGDEDVCHTALDQQLDAIWPKPRRGSKPCGPK